MSWTNSGPKIQGVIIFINIREGCSVFFQFKNLLSSKFDDSFFYCSEISSQITKRDKIQEFLWSKSYFIECALTVDGRMHGPIWLFTPRFPWVSFVIWPRGTSRRTPPLSTNLTSWSTGDPSSTSLSPGKPSQPSTCPKRAYNVLFPTFFSTASSITR